MSTKNEFNPCAGCEYFKASQEALKEEQQARRDAYKILEAGRDWLMTVEAERVSVNDALEAFGFSSDGGFSD